MPGIEVRTAERGWASSRASISVSSRLRWSRVDLRLAAGLADNGDEHGTIPARVGNTDIGTTLGFSQGGPTPHARGAPNVRSSASSWCRTIPARAGSTVPDLRCYQWAERKSFSPSKSDKARMLLFFVSIIVERSAAQAPSPASLLHSIGRLGRVVCASFWGCWICVKPSGATGRQG